jgi:phytoene synthase
MRNRSLFKKSSTTFYTSSLFFPGAVRADVFDLYVFVRLADNYVDQKPADREGFYKFRKTWDLMVKELAAINSADQHELKIRTNSNDEQACADMLRVSLKYDFDFKWVEKFLDAMESDLNHRPCQTVEDTIRYTYGSAEVIGLMMAKIMGLPKEATEAARLQGRAMQLINFIRDIDEDNRLGRQYLPGDELKLFNLPDLSYQTAHNQTREFTEFIHFQLQRYDGWQLEAAEGYSYIPRRLQIPIKTASDMYNWTGRQIYKNPLVIYHKKVKPSRQMVIKQYLKNISY